MQEHIPASNSAEARFYEEIRDIESRLHESLSLLSVIADSTVDAVFVKDAEGRYRFANNTVVRIFARPIEEIIGRSDHDFLSPDISRQLLDNDHRIMATGKADVIEEAVPEADGEIRTYQSTKSPFYDAQGNIVGIIGIARDVTDQKRAEAALHRQTEALSLLYEAGTGIGQTLDLAQVYDTFQTMIARSMSCDGLLVSQYAPDDQSIRCVYAWIEGNRVDTSAFPTIKLAPEGQGLQSGVIRTGQAIRIDDFAEHQRQHTALYFPTSGGQVRATPEKNTTESLLMVPILLDGRVLGVVQVQSHARNAYTPDHLRLLEALTLQVAAASRNAYLYREAQDEIAERRRVESERETALAENARLLHEMERVTRQQRGFLRDMLASVTDGRLRLCDTADDLPRHMVPFGDPIPLASRRDIRPLRLLACEAAETMGFPDDRWHDLETAVGEAAMNAVIHAGSGVGYVYTSRDENDGGGAAIVQVWITDEGAGISVEDLPRATLEKGYTTAGTLGHGFKMILQTISRVWLLTGPTGTTVVLEQDRKMVDPSWLPLYQE